MYTLKIYHDVKIEEDEDEDGELVLDQNKKESKYGFFTGHSYIALNNGVDEPIVRGFYPNNVYKDDSKRIKLSAQFKEENPNFNSYHVKEIKLNKEQYNKALNELNKYDKYIDLEKKEGVLPKEVVNGMWNLLGNNCSDFTNTIYRSTGLSGSFTYQYTSAELKQIPGAIEYYIDRFGVGDKNHIVTGNSIQDIATRYNVDKSLISKTKTTDFPLDQDAKNMQGLGPQFFSIAPNPKLIMQKELTPQLGTLGLNKLMNQQMLNSIKNNPYISEKERIALTNKIHESNKAIQDIQPSLTKALKTMQIKMQKSLQEWKLKQNQPETKLAKFGFSKEDILSNPIKTQFLMKNYEQFSFFCSEIKQRLNIQINYNDLPNDLTKLQLVIDYTDSIIEFFDNQLILSINDLPDDTKLLETLLESEMAIVHLKELEVVNRLSEVAVKVKDLSVLKDFELTSEVAINILESQGMYKEAKKAKLHKEIALMTEEQQLNSDLLLQELENRVDTELFDYYKQLVAESKVLGDTEM